MSTKSFHIIEHTIPCQHVREYPRGTRSMGDDILHLAIKQYVPLNARETEKNAVTVIGAAANGFPKEAYEPLWIDLLAASKAHNFAIRGIWVADMSNQGISGVLNENSQGDDPSYFDHSRDLLHMLNTFRDQIPRPIVGIGHSLGATQLVGLSHMHPRLFASLLLVEPMIQQDVPPGFNASLPSSLRADLWPSRAAAEAAFRKNRFFKQLDPRVLDNVVTYGLRKTPTAVHPTAEKLEEGSYTLTTSKHQEVWSYLRPNFRPIGERGAGDEPSAIERLLAPDVNHQWQGKYLFYRPELGIAFEYLTYLRPSVLYVFGGKSIVSMPALQDAKMERTGGGLGGSGGVKSGQVKKVVREKWGHMFPLEHVAGTAEILAIGLQEHLRKWAADEQILADEKSGKSERNGLMISKEWLEHVRKDSVTQRPLLEKGKL